MLNCNADHCEQIIVGPVGYSEPKAQNVALSFHPNPVMSSNGFSILISNGPAWENEDYQLALYGMDVRKMSIRSTNVEGEIMHFSVADLVPGVYTVLVSTREYRYSGRVIVQ